MTATAAVADRDGAAPDGPAGDEPVRAGWRDLLRITRGHRTAIAAALGFSLAGAVLGLLQPLLAGTTIDQAGRDGSVWRWLPLLAVVFVGEAVVTGIGHYLLERAGEGVVLGLRLHVVGRLLRWPIRRYSEHRLGDLLTRTTGDTTLLRDSLAYDLVEAAVGVFVIIGGIAMMITLDAVLLVLVVAIVGVVGGCTTLLLAGIRRAVQDAQDNLGDMSAELERALSTVRTVRVMRAQDREEQRIGDRARAAYASGLQAVRRTAVINPTLTLALHGALVTVLVVGGLRVANGEASVADLASFLLYVTYVTAPMVSVFDVFASLQRGMAALQRVQEVARVPVEDDDRPRPATRTAPRPSPAHPSPGHPVPALEFRDVAFAYDPGRPVLRGVSFRAAPHAITVLAGPSGAGKSTIFGLVARFHDPSGGTVLLHGRDVVRELSADECRASIGLVEQDSPVMHGTLRDNITYADPEATGPDVRRAVRLAGLEDLVDRLPHGLDTRVGEHGGTLSGGERQRIAIARALLPRPRLLLLDEPASHLDAANEAVLTATVEALRPECSLLVIAHRGAAVESADHVVVLNDGRVDAAGPPDGRRPVRA